VLGQQTEVDRVLQKRESVMGKRIKLSARSMFEVRSFCYSQMTRR